jgi:hypothetical protein
MSFVFDALFVHSFSVIPVQAAVISNTLITALPCTLCREFASRYVLATARPVCLPVGKRGPALPPVKQSCVPVRIAHRDIIRIRCAYFMTAIATPQPSSAGIPGQTALGATPMLKTTYPPSAVTVGE